MPIQREESSRRFRHYGSMTVSHHSDEGSSACLGVEIFEPEQQESIRQPTRKPITSSTTSLFRSKIVHGLVLTLGVMTVVPFVLMHSLSSGDGYGYGVTDLEQLQTSMSSSSCNHRCFVKKLKQANLWSRQAMHQLNTLMDMDDEEEESFLSTERDTEESSTSEESLSQKIWSHVFGRQVSGAESIINEEKKKQRVILDMLDDNHQQQHDGDSGLDNRAVVQPVPKYLERYSSASAGRELAQQRRKLKPSKKELSHNYVEAAEDSLSQTRTPDSDKGDDDSAMEQPQAKHQKKGHKHHARATPPSGCEVTVQLIRHCEKGVLEDHCDYQGFERAQFLTTLFGNSNAVSDADAEGTGGIQYQYRWPIPSEMYALDPRRFSGKQHKPPKLKKMNMREVETLLPCKCCGMVPSPMRRLIHWCARKIIHPISSRCC
jgi:hypothetical protein